MDDARLRHLLRKRIARVGGGRKYALKHGIPEVNIWQFLHGRRPPAPSLLDTMNIEKVTFYRYKKKPGLKQGRYGTIYGDADE